MIQKHRGKTLVNSETKVTTLTGDQRVVFHHLLEDHPDY